MAAAAAPPRSRLAGLDVLRCIAILLVLVRHAWTPPTPLPGIARPLFEALRRGGWAGVDLFFVLSGFLVSGLLFSEYRRHGEISPWRFYARRGLKIYPAFYLLIVTTVAVTAFTGTVPLRRVLAELFFVQSYVQGLWGYTWSLAIEEHFYLLLPLLLLGIRRLDRSDDGDPFRAVVPVGLVIALWCLTARTANWALRDGFVNMTHVFATHLRLDSLFFGVVISYFYHFHRERFVATLKPWRWALIIGGAVLFLPVFLYRLGTTPFIYTVGFSLLYLGGGACLTGVLLCEPRPNRVLAALAAIGVYSYSIYLWHIPVLEWLNPAVARMIGRPLGVTEHTILFMGGSIGVGIALSRLVELPVLRIRDRWFPSRSGAVAAAQIPVPQPHLTAASEPAL